MEGCGLVGTFLACVWLWGSPGMLIWAVFLIIVYVLEWAVEPPK